MKGRSIILTAIVGGLGVCVGLQARPMTADDAEMVVRGWLKVDPRPLGALLGREVAFVETFPGDARAPICHVVYLEPAGFVIVSADDRIEPIIGFVAGGTYDPSPDDPLGALVKDDLVGRTAATGGGGELSAQSSDDGAAQARRKWDDLIRRAQPVGDGIRVMADPAGSYDYLSEVRVGPLLTDAWQQSATCGSPSFTYYTPNNYVCGCVALSAAQVMHYHKYPTAGIGVRQFEIGVDGRPQSAYTRGGDGNGGPYKWDLMPDCPGCQTSQEQREAIGALCHDAGAGVGTSYSAVESGAETSTIALRGLFQYASAINESDYRYYLNDRVNSNLDGAYPVILYIGGSAGGHALVCDGYGYSASTMYHHLNLGRKGMDDAWYNLSNLDAPGYSGGTFNRVGGMTYNIFPSGSGEIVSGRIMDGFARPVAWATVTTEGEGGPYVTTTTNAGGIYALTHVRSDTDYTIGVSKQGYSFGSRHVRTGKSSDGSPPGNRWGVDFVGFLDRPSREDFETGSFNQLPWERKGLEDGGWSIASSWQGSSTNYSARADYVGDGEIAVMSLTLDCLSGEIAFRRKVSSEPHGDFLIFRIDGQEKARWSGEEDWARVSFPVAEGIRTFEWTYAKDASSSQGDDTAWIDDIVFPPARDAVVVLDDFESYNDSDHKISDAWIDGRGNSKNGAIIGYPGPPLMQREHIVETAGVYGGAQSMPYFYDTTRKRSEATLTLKNSRDWTQQGMKALSLWFRAYSAPAGSFVFTGGNGNGFEMTAAGADIGGRADECHYAYKRLTGPGAIETRVERVQKVHEWAKGGVMIREDLDAGSKFVALSITPACKCVFQTRTVTNADAVTDASVTISGTRGKFTNTWLKLERDADDNFFGYYKEATNDAWKPMPWNPLHLPMSAAVYAGVAATSHDPGRTCQAIFTWVKIAGATAGTQVKLDNTSDETLDFDEVNEANLAVCQDFLATFNAEIGSDLDVTFLADGATSSHKIFLAPYDSANTRVDYAHPISTTAASNPGAGGADEPLSATVILTSPIVSGTRYAACIVPSQYMQMKLTRSASSIDGQSSKFVSWVQPGPEVERDTDFRIRIGAGWSHQDIGRVRNTPAQMYVSIAGGAGGRALVYHDDPAVSLRDTWTQWKIDLKQFADQGVDLTDVDTISIGFGEQRGSRSGASGLVFFDDVWLCEPQGATSGSPGE